jgi:carboxypeptidase T
MRRDSVADSGAFPGWGGVVMGRGIAGLLLAAVVASSSAIAADQTQVVRAWFTEKSKLEQVTPLLGHAQIDRRKGLLRVDADPWLRAQLIAAGFRVEVDVESTEAMQRLARAFANPKSIPGFDCYRTVEEAQARIVELANDYPDLATYQDIGPSWQQTQGSGGYPLRVLKLGNAATPGPKPILFLIGSIHAREYTPAELVLRFAEELVDGYGIDADATWILDHHEIQVLVHGNPDGRKRAETGLSWRKNVNNGACPNTNSRGIDLNRNFPFVWGQYNGSSPVACEDTYRGPSAMSEPETQAIVNHVRSIYPDRRGPALTDPAPTDTAGIFIDVHSYSQLVLWPWGFIETDAPNATALQVLGRRFAGFNGYASQAAIGLYPTDGTTDDFAYGELGVASYAMELGTAFFQSCDVFKNQVLPPNRNLLRYAARVLRTPYLTPAGPDAYDASVQPDLILSGDAALISATLDDARQQTGIFDNSGPVPPVQPIASARAYLQTPPWRPGASPIAMNASDGSFNASVERAQATLPTASLGEGRHLVFVQGRDTAGNDGPVGAAFVEVVAAEDAATLSGIVTDVVSGAPLQAQVQVGAWQSQSDPGDGGYERLVRAGTYDIDVVASGYERESVTAQSFAPGAAVERDFALYRVCPVLSDPVNTAGLSPLVAQSHGGTIYWTRRAGAGQDGGAAWLPSPSGNYGNSRNTALTSATLDLGGYTSTTLAFDQRCATEATFDFGIVEVSTNGGTSWSEVFRCDGDYTWRRVELALPQLDGQSQARLRFRFTSDGGVVDAGWALDNIVLSAGGATCRAGQQPNVRIDRFDATPAQIAPGGSTLLDWSTANATACQIGSSLGGAPIVLAPGELASGTRSVSPVADATYTLSCSGNGGPVTAQASVDVQTPAPVSIGSFAAAPTTIVAGASSTLSWSTQNAQSCDIASSLGGAPTPIGAGALASGSLPVSPAQSATYTLSCEGPSGPVSAQASVTVTPAPVAIDAFAAQPTQIVAGQNSTLSWTTQRASACQISSSLGGSPIVLGAGELASGSRQVAPAQTATFTLSCSGNGDASAQASVTVTPAPVVIDAFAAQPTQIVAGQDSTLSWTTQRATGCQIASSLGGAAIVLGAGELAAGTRQVAPAQDATYTLSCSGPSGPVSANAGIQVSPPLPDAVFEDGFE